MHKGIRLMNINKKQRSNERVSQGQRVFRKA